MSEETTEGPEPSHTCPNGHPVEAEAVFCDRCGISLIHPIGRSMEARGGELDTPESASPPLSPPSPPSPTADFPTGIAPPPSGVGPTPPKKPWYKRPAPVVVAAALLIAIVLVVAGAATKKNAPSAGSSSATSSRGGTSSASAPTTQPPTTTTAAPASTQPQTIRSVETLLSASSLGVCHVSSDSGQSALGSDADINLFLPSECGNPTYYGPGIVLSSFPSASSAQAGAVVFAKINGFDPWILNNLVFNGQDLTSGETDTFHGEMQSIGATLVPSIGVAYRYNFTNSTTTTTTPPVDWAPILLPNANRLRRCRGYR